MPRLSAPARWWASSAARYLLLIVLLLGFWAYAPVPAHAHKGVIAGPYRLTIGWASEPPYVGVLNGLELIIVEREGDEPVTGAADTLRFEVQYGGQSVELPLRPVAGEDGHYTSELLPTQRGIYTFRFIGAIQDEPVDVATDVEEVVDSSALRFPAAGQGADDPLRVELEGVRLLAIAGLVVGVLGLAVGVAGVVLGRRARK